MANHFADLVGFLSLPDLAQIANPNIYVAAVTIALVASLETLLNLEAVDKIDPRRRVSPPNRELIAQGTGNFLCGLIGGLPVTSVIVRSSVNINAGAQSKRSALVHGALLLLCVGFLPGWLNRIPLSALAAVLVVTGYKLASPKLFRQMWDAGMEQFLPFTVTIAAILVTDLLIGIVIGLGFSILFILRSNLRRPLDRTLEKHIDAEVLCIELANQVSFLNRVAIRKALNEAPRGGHVLLDARGTDYIDADVLSVIREFETETAPARQVEVSLLGFKSHYEQMEDRVRYVDLATRELQRSLSPDQVLEILREGNQRFRDGRPLKRDLRRLREGTSRSRHPLAVILSGCSSRTPIELLFDAGIGDLFCARSTGNSLGFATVGSLEYACKIAGAKAIVVLGHTDNKAVGLALDTWKNAAAADSVRDCGSLTSILQGIQGAATEQQKSAWAMADEGRRQDLVDQVSRLHVQHTVRQIEEQSPVLAELARAGDIKILGGIYDVTSGKVELFSPTDEEQMRSDSHATSSPKADLAAETSGRRPAEPA